MPPDVGVIGWYKPTAQGRNGFSDITSGRVQLNFRWIDQSTSPEPSQWTNVAHISRDAGSQSEGGVLRENLYNDVIINAAQHPLFTETR